MTSETEAIKTNEFLRRRKLRLQQVREQSKDIAKKIRQRAKVEKLRQVVDLDAKKQKEYFECQEKLVKRLEVLYSRGLENVGASHQSASEVTQQEEVVKTDLSKLRGKEATAELRRKKQEKLDQQKKILDRKLQAREVANVISRDKSSLVANKLLSKSITTKESDDPPQKAGSSSELANTQNIRDAEKSNNNSEAVKTSDMATQWDMETMPNEWEPAVPALSLPTDKDTPKDSEDYAEGSRTEKNKRLDLFALSKEMPSSLRGKHTHVTKERDQGRPSLTIVSEYLQTRKLRLRETDTTSTHKNAPDDMQSLKQTILRTRSSKPEVSGKGMGSTDKVKNMQENTLNRKSSVMMYNHSTRDSRDLPYGDDNLVVRNLQCEEDAYSLAMKQVSALGIKSKGHHKVQDMRNKVAVTKQNVEKEFKDTMNFLNSLPKDKCSKVIKNAYMDERRQQLQHENRQQKMQQEYKKIEKECKRHHSLNISRNKSKSPTKQDLEENFDSRDLQYSWMPVPESDGNLAIHAIPNTVKQGKSGNSVKFSKIDSYHEYRSRHKHTPPTKDTTQDKRTGKRILEAVVIDKDPTESSDTSSVTTDTSSVENLRIDMRSKRKTVKDINRNLSDAERIIVYKVLDSKTDKKTKRQTKLLNEIAKSLTCIEKVQKTSEEDAEELKKQQTKHIRSTSKSADNAVSFEKLNEGVYKMVEEQGASYNMMSCCTTNVALWHSTTARKPWWDNVTSMYFNDCDKMTDTQSDHFQNRSSPSKKLSKNEQIGGTALQWESGDCLQRSQTSNECQRPSASKEKANKPAPPMQPSTVPSTSSFITATNDKGNEGGYIKLIDETGQEAGKFFIGATGFLNNNTYEVVIQLRKKDGAQQKNNADSNTTTNDDKQSASENNNDESNEKDQPISSEADANDVPPAFGEDIREVLAYRSTIHEGSTVITPQDDLNTKTTSEESNVLVDNNKQASEENTEVDHLFCVPSSSVKKDTCDKAVQNLSQVTKQEQPPRAATTSCTQTSSSSPIHRPVFFHMSSSTSTAYMSPPEMVLPQFLRHEYGMIDNEIYDPIHTIEMTEKEYCEEYAGCTCRKCVHARKVKLSKINMPMCCKKKKYDSQAIKTPPNSAHNILESTNEVSQESKLRCKTARVDKPKCKHNNRGSGDVKRHCHRNKRPSAENIRLTRNMNMRPSGSGMSPSLTRNRCKSLTSNRDKKRSQSRLNPIIKDYVNKLLALNKEGLKAVEVADQECSSVCTPGSSIINVPYNVDERKSSMGNTISLQQIKNVLKQQILEEQFSKKMNYTHNSLVYSVSNNKNNLKYSSSRTSRKKPVHKVKSLNISKHLIKNNKNCEEKSSKAVSQLSNDENINIRVPSNTVKNCRSKSSPTPRELNNSGPLSRFNDSESTAKYSIGTNKSDDNPNSKSGTSIRAKSASSGVRVPGSHQVLISSRATATDSTVDSDSLGPKEHKSTEAKPVSMSTQTSQKSDMNSDTNFMKLAEDKLHNMEKIADLTEKCTKRLSNLAKVLQEVRKNKSLAYSQISSAESTDSQSDHKSDKPEVTSLHFDPTSVPQISEAKSPGRVPDKESSVENEITESDFITVLTDIPKPMFNLPPTNETLHSEITDTLDSPLHLSAHTAELAVKSRPKPPPALSRLNFKHGQEFIVPHELSTVIEVDSPMSVKHKNQAARNDAKEAFNNSNRSSPEDNGRLGDSRKNESIKELSENPDLLQTNRKSKKYKFSSNESSDDSKFHMIDLKQFNEIMLEPFISIQEYAKQYNMEPPDEGSNLEDIQREDVINDDMSSLHSDGSLPDVIAELLKRNIITEPFKFDTASNINSTTISSESTLSMLALSKVRRDRKRSNAFQNKENIGETSDTLSISSNPDLENAFKKLGMGWASSTLKKTKERLALSSSSNTSSSSLSQFKIKTFNPDIPALVTDSVSSAVNVSQAMHNRTANDSSKNAEQQTTLSNSMTVKEFLRNELAKKITFTNKSNANDTQEEFVSLFETKMPDEMKETSQVNRDERSIDSAPNRARTSTPVQIFKSMTYHSSSSSNVSNGLFSNADDLSSVKMTSNSNKNHSTSDKDDLTIPNFSLRMKKSSDCSKSD